MNWEGEGYLRMASPMQTATVAGFALGQMTNSLVRNQIKCQVGNTVSQEYYSCKVLCIKAFLLLPVCRTYRRGSLSSKV